MEGNEVFDLDSGHMLFSCKQIKSVSLEAYIPTWLRRPGGGVASIQMNTKANNVFGFLVMYVGSVLIWRHVTTFLGCKGLIWVGSGAMPT